MGDEEEATAHGKNNHFPGGCIQWENVVSEAKEWQGEVRASEVGTDNVLKVHFFSSWHMASFPVQHYQVPLEYEQKWYVPLSDPASKVLPRVLFYDFSSSSSWMQMTMKSYVVVMSQIERGWVLECVDEGLLP